MESSRRLVSSGSPFEPSIGFSRAVRVGNHVAVTGTAPIGSGGTVGAGDVYVQTRRCLQIIEDALQAAGAESRQVVRTRVVLVSADTWQEAARAHGEFFGDIRPASTFVVVQVFIDPTWLVEIEADAVVDP